MLVETVRDAANIYNTRGIVFLEIRCLLKLLLGSVAHSRNLGDLIAFLQPSFFHSICIIPITLEAFQQFLSLVIDLGIFILVFDLLIRIFKVAGAGTGGVDWLLFLGFL